MRPGRPTASGSSIADQVGESLELFRCGPDGNELRQLTKFGGRRHFAGRLPGREVDLVPALRRDLLA